MAQGRILSKRVTKSEKVAALSSDTARMIYSWLIPYTDVEGRMEVNYKLLKSDIAPLLDHITAAKIEKILDELHAVGLIVLYSIEEKNYLEIVKFEEHQPNLRKDREKDSTIPPCPAELRQNSGNSPSELPPKIKIKNKINIRERENALSQKNKFLDSVFLSGEEYKKLQEALGQKSLDIGIEKLDYSITVKSGKYKDHYKTLLNWFKRGFLVEGSNGNGTGKRNYQQHTGRELPPDIAESADATTREWLEKKRLAAAGKDRKNA